MRKLSFFSAFLIFNLNAQNVGINTSTPAAALDVQSAGNSSATMAVSVSNSGNDTLIVVRDNGNVGIGTTQPGAPLDVQTQGNLAARFNAPVEGQPAINSNELVTLGQLQAVSAGSSSAGIYSLPSQWSNDHLSGLTYVGALVYCRNLNQGGHTDWRVPSTEELTYLILESSIPLPSFSTTFVQYWLRAANLEQGSTSTNIAGRANTLYFTGDWNTSYINVTSTAQNHFTICVR